MVATLHQMNENLTVAQDSVTRLLNLAMADLRALLGLPPYEGTPRAVVHGITYAMNVLCLQNALVWFYRLFLCTFLCCLRPQVRVTGTASAC